MALNGAKLSRLKAEAKPRKYSGGGGLHVLVPTSGAKLWKLAYRFEGKQRTLCLAFCRFRGHEDKIVTKELESGYDETEVQP